MYTFVDPVDLLKERNNLPKWQGKTVELFYIMCNKFMLIIFRNYFYSLSFFTTVKTFKFVRATML